MSHPMLFCFILWSWIDRVELETSLACIIHELLVLDYDCPFCNCNINGFPVSSSYFSSNRWSCIMTALASRQRERWRSRRPTLPSSPRTAATAALAAPWFLPAPTGYPWGSCTTRTDSEQKTFLLVLSCAKILRLWLKVVLYGNDPYTMSSKMNFGLFLLLFHSFCRWHCRFWVTWASLRSEFGTTTTREE